MKFEVAFQGSTYRVAHAEPKAGESVTMEAAHLQADGTLVPIPYLTRGALVAIDCEGGQHLFGPGGEENTVFPKGRFSIVATEDGDYWCTSPLPGNRVIREGRHILAPGASAMLDPSYIVNALFTAPATVNDTPIDKGQVVRLSPGRKTVQAGDEGVHVILFRTEAV